MDLGNGCGRLRSQIAPRAMSASTPMLKVIPLAVLTASAAVGATTAMQVKVGEMLRNEYRFDPEKIPAEAPATRAREEAPVVLPAYTVSDRRLLLAVERALRRQEQEATDKAYSLVRGGTIVEREIGRAKVELGTWALGPNLALVRISW